MNPDTAHVRHVRRGFSLVEVLLAMFILGIGLIMVASIFPVAGNWTQQATEQTVGETIAQTALTSIKAHYGLSFTTGATPTNSGVSLLSPLNPGNTVINGTTPFQFQGLPDFYNQVPLNERAYRFGASKPWPVDLNPDNSRYFWTALVRVSPQHADPTWNLIKSSSYTYDLYIFVFQKGDLLQTFAQNPTNLTFNPTTDPADPNSKVPVLRYDTLVVTPGTSAVPRIGEFGVGFTSGTIFRQVPSGTDATPLPTLPGSEMQVLRAPAADGNSSSPLIYVYSTTITE